MSHGLRIWTAQGVLQMDSINRLGRFLVSGTVSVPRSAVYGDVVTVNFAALPTTSWDVSGYRRATGTGFTNDRHGDIWKITNSSFAIRRSTVAAYTWTYIVIGF